MRASNEGLYRLHSEGDEANPSCARDILTHPPWLRRDAAFTQASTS